MTPAGQLPPAAMAVQKFPDFLRRPVLDSGFRILNSVQCRPKMRALRHQPDLRQFVERQADERRTEHGDGRHVLQRIVQQLQQAQQIQDFPAVVKSAAPDNEWHARALKFLCINFRLARRRRAAEPPCRAIRQGENVFLSASQISWFTGFKLLQPPGKQPRLFFRLRQIGQIVSAGFIADPLVAAFFESQQQFRARRRLPCRAQFPRGGRTRRIAAGPRHRNATPPISSRMSGSKTEFTKLSSPSRLRKFSGERNRPAVVSAPVLGVIAEDFRVGQPETVDALLHIADEETVAWFGVPPFRRFGLPAA